MRRSKPRSGLGNSSEGDGGYDFEDGRRRRASQRNPSWGRSVRGGGGCHAMEDTGRLVQGLWHLSRISQTERDEGERVRADILAEERCASSRGSR